MDGYINQYGTQGNEKCEELKPEGNDCTDTGDKVPDGEGIDSEKNFKNYINTYGTNNNA